MVQWQALYALFKNSYKLFVTIYVTALDEPNISIITRCQDVVGSSSSPLLCGREVIRPEKRAINEAASNVRVHSRKFRALGMAIASGDVASSVGAMGIFGRKAP